MGRTVVLIKPDAVKSGFIGQIITRLEKAGFVMVAAKLLYLEDKIIDVWYGHHKEKPFFPELKSFMQSAPIMAMLWEGDEVVAKIRTMAGITDSTKAEKGTIRSDFGRDVQMNAVHISDSVESANKETNLIFSPEEICEHQRN
ncbi:MAG: Nucleoside diphosphate kinase [Candidatus Gottesmanbacteria bacterium GW2011_GWC2_39_8]|uniref:Nucleoside diphosphate kinase n=1 Tax=Candidatus Gottesmanbacteria bacterium GW2011_GWC2_39_8 TaxID=1618450 RepID=A0A0G0Q5Z1_9BACT|nr:MAG: Nucleoside diphosphate kinase [Candidatus Gottesmanbacteria bacterium GW2011_GWC2_39_8]